ncbi:MAG: retention module-containing protein, partial [Endozoicomonas sp.]|uniref:retention module-containing protein n=1 Tax=Endozoicomonas sp. TaxID=1892382 RepID=UPI003D9BA636
MQSDSDGSRPVIGHIQETDGNVVVIAPDGSKRFLQEGDPLYLNDRVVSESSDSTSIRLLNNQVIQLGGQSQLIMQQSMMQIAEIEGIPESSEVKEIQTAIADGADPVKVSEPSSAGESDSPSRDQPPPVSSDSPDEASILKRDAPKEHDQTAYDLLSEAKSLATFEDDDEEELTGTHAVNYAPTAHNMIMGSSENGTELEGKLHVYDANTGETLTFSLVSSPSSGQLILNEDGSFRFQTGSDFEYLAAGEQSVVTFIFKVTDSSGASSQASVDITINGVNDAPEVSGPVSADIVQNDGETIIDLLSQASDKDRSDTLSVEQLRLTNGNETGVSIGLDSSSLSINPEAYKYLAEGESETLTYQYQVTDSQGESVPQSVTVTLSGTNDQPQVREAIIQTSDQNSDDFDIDLLAGAFDIDATDTLNVVSLRLTAGDPAGISVSDDGNSLAVDTSAYEHLAEGESEEIEYSYEIDDGHGGTVSQSSSITIEGINDNPEDLDLSGTHIDENQDGAVVGTLSTTDKDLSDTHTYAVDDNRFEVVDGELKLKDDIALNHETDESIDVEVTTTDVNGAAYSESFTVEVNDINEAPISADSSTLIDEDSLYRFTLNDFPYSDEDVGDQLEAVVIETLPDSGSLELNGSQISEGDAITRADISAGLLTFLPEANESADNYARFNFRVNDGELSSDIQTFTVNVTPLADAASLDLDGSETVTTLGFESGLGDWSTSNGLEIHGSDVMGDPHSGSRLAELDAGSGGTPDALIYTVNTNQGHDHQLTLWLRQRDNDDSTDDVEIVWNGEVIATIDPATTWGEHTIALPNTDQASTVVQIREVASQNQGSGPIVDDISVVRLGVQDSNDPAIDYTISSYEDTPVPLSLSSALADTDGSETYQLVLSGAPTGSIITDGNQTVTADGSDIDISSWQQNTLRLTPSANSHSDFTLTFTATTSESANNDQSIVSKTLHVDLIPVDDAPVAGNVDLGSILEDTSYVITANDLLASANDVDGDSLSVESVTLTDPATGSLTDNNDGTWSYTPTEHYFGDDVTFNFTVSDGTSGDEASASATLDVTSVNDNPELTGIIDDNVTEDTGTQSIDLLQGASDPDIGDVLEITQLRLISGDDSGITTTSSTLEIDTTAYQYLGEGVTETLSYVFNITDGNGGSSPQFATITLTGTNDSAVIGGVDMGLVTEDHTATLTASGDLTVTDADDNEAEFQADTLSGNHGQLSIDSDGSWVYSADNSQSTIQALGHGDSLTDSFTVQTADGTEHTVTATIHGTNDAPVVTAGGNLAYTENDGSQVIDGHITLADIDSVTMDSATVTISGNFSSGEDSLAFTDHNGISGSWDSSSGTMTLSGTATVAQYQEALRTVTYSNSSESPSIADRTISFSVDDGHDSSNIATSTITVTAVNDAPDTADTLVISDEDTPYIFTTSDFTFSDPDAGQTLQSIKVTQLPSAGELLYNGSAVTADMEVTRNDLLAGRLRFEPSENENGNLYASFEFQVGDGELFSSSATFDFNITPVNDDPTVSAAISDSFVEDTASVEINLLDHASDIDTGDSLSVAQLTLSSGNDSGITINGTILTVDPGAYDYLPDGVTETIVYSYDVEDGNGSSASQTASLVITGTNDNALITGVDTATVAEDSHASSLTTSGTLTASDADQGEAQFQAETLTGNYGDLVIDANGQWAYTADNSLLAIQGLDDGDTLSETFEVTTEGYNTHNVTITITGTNDAPVIDAGMMDQSATEEQAFSYQLPSEAFADIDGDNLTYSATLNDGNPLPSWVTFNPSNGTFSGTPDDPDLGQIIVKVIASDGDLSASGQFKINVTAVNDPPELQSSPLVDDIITALDFNTGAGLMANDISTEGNNASFSGNVNWVSGHDNTGSAFNMDGTAGSAELQGMSTGGAMTLSAWVQFDSFDEHWSRILDFGNGQSDNNIVLGHTGSNNGIGFHIYSGGADDPKGTLEINNFFTAGEWVHVTATVEADGTMSIFRNGELAGQADGVVPAEMVRTGNFLGKSQWSDDGYLDGSIDELIIANGAVDADQAKAIYQADTVNNLLSDSFHVEEHSTSGTQIGTASATDVDNPNLSYSLTNDAGGRFTIDSDTGVITVATSDSTLLDHETSGSHNITVQVSDGSLTDTRAFTIYLTDANDAPEAQNETVSTLEDSSYTFSVSDFNFTDEDEGDSLSQIRIENLPDNGDLQLNGESVSQGDSVSKQDIESGLLTFTPVLNANGDGYDSFSFSVADQQDIFSVSQNVMTIDVTAVNDAPVFSAGISHTVNEDQTITLTEAQLLINASDIDGDDLSVSNVTVDNGSVGVTDNGNGTWTITPIVHWSGTSQLSFDISDGNESVTNTLSMAITPDADAPSVLFNNSAQNATVIANEDTNIALNLGVDLTDIDGSETLNVLVEGIPSGAEITDGSEITTSTGGPINVSSWNLANLSVTPVDHHETDFTISVTATATEQSGGDSASTTREILIDIQPQNDAAIITGVNTGTVTEDDFSTYGPLGQRELIASGDLDVQEFDAGEASFLAETVTGSYGELTINSDGQWEYIADSRQSDIQELGVTETLQDTLTVQSSDGTTHDVTITIQGANDQGDGAPVFLGTLAEDNSLIINESLILNAVNDIDGDTLTVSTISLPVGGHSITNNNDGTWTLNPAPDFNGMLEMLYVVSDGTLGYEVNNLVRVNITSVADTAVISGDDTASLTEDSAATLTATGSLSVVDPDAGEAGFNSETISGNYGDLTIDSDGNWNYSADNNQAAIQALGDGDSLIETLQIQSIDGTTQNIVITLNGTNDTAVIGGVNTAAVAEDDAATLTTSGALTVADSDSDESSFLAETVNGSYGTLTIDEEGNWAYSADNTQAAIQTLGDGDSLTETLQVQSAEGTTQNIIITINGTNDAAVIDGVSTATLTEDTAATLTTSGTLTIADTDSGEASFTAETISGSYGSLTIDSSGNWNYSADNSQTAIQALGNNDTLQETLTVQSLDGTEQEITITLAGSNDGPVLDSAITSQSVTEDSSFNFQVPVDTFSDAESDVLTYTATQGDGSALPPWLGFNASTRTFFGMPDNEDVGTLSLKVTATDPDGSSASSTFNLDVTNTNDAPVMVFQESGGLLVLEAENFHSNVSRSGETWSTENKGGASGGEVITTADGSGAYQGSTEGNSAEVNYEVQVDTPGTYYVWIKGYAADGNADSVHLGLDGQYLNSSDAITSFGSDGNWSTGTMDSATASIEITEAGRHQINLWVREDGFQADKIILTTDPDFVPNGNGPDESSYLNAPANQNATEDTAFSYTVSEEAFSDVDSGDSLSWSATLSDGNPLPDWLSFDSTTRTFSGTPENADVGSLNIRIIVDDGEATNSTEISLTVANVNDSAVITGVDTGSVTEDDAATLTASGKLDVTDVDTGESSFTAANFVGDYGTLAIDSEGNWNYSAESSQAPIQQLDDGESLSETFSVQSVDGTTKDITITLNGSNDTPTVSSAIDLGNIDEDTSLTITEAQLLATASDIDGDSLSISSLTLTDSNQGSVTDNGNNTWTFTPTANFNGDDVSFSFVVSDGHSGANGTAVVDINALADSPVISPDISETLVSEWGFEDTVISSDWQDVNTSPEGWSSTAGHFEFQRNGADDNTAFEGNQWLELDTNQTLDAISYQADTSDGQPFILEFATRERRPDTTDDFEIYWNGEQIATITPTDSWTVHRIELPPTGEDQTSIEIRESSGANDFEGSLIDDLKVLKVGISASDDPAYDFSITSLEDTSIPLNLGTVTSGGTESITTSLAGIPTGSVLTDGTHTVNADGNTIDVSDWNLTALSLTPPAHSHSDFTITIAATATEGNGDSASSSSSLRVELLPENDSPTAISLDALSVSENSAGAIVGNLSTADADSGDNHSYSVNDNRFEIVNGQLKLKDGISLDHETEDNISLSVTTEDSEGATYPESFSLSVTDINDAPITTAATSHSVDEDNSQTITKAELLANTSDVDGDILSVSNVQVTSGQVSVTDNGNDTWTITPSSDWSGNGQLSFDISDGTVTVAGQADITVTAFADAPDISITGTTVISSMNFNSGLASGWTSEHDAEIHNSGGPVGTSNSGTNITGLDAGGSGNPDAFYYSVDTGQGHDHQISLWVKQRDNYDGTDEIEIVWNGEVIQTIDPGTSWEEVTISLPDTNQTSTQLTVREVAGQNNGVGPLLDQITISRLGADDSTDSSYDKMISSQEDTRIALDLSSSLSDSDGSETLSVSLSGIPAGFALSDGTNSVTTDGSAIDASSWNLSNLTITPVANHDTDFTITVASTATEASNNDTATHTQTIRVDMQPVSDAAVFTGDDSGTLTEDAAATLTTSGNLSVSDADGSASFVAETVNGSYGSLTINAEGNWTYSADNTQNSIQSLDDGEQLTDAITISSNDGTTHTVEITIQGTNDAPSLGSAQTVTTNEDTSFTLTEAELLTEVSATDIDAETLSVSNVSISSGSISVTDNGNGTWTFAPDANWSGSGQISLDVSDGTATVSGQVDVLVSPDADAPVITPSGSQIITSIDFENNDIAAGWSSENTPEINQASVYGVTDSSGGNGYIMDLDDEGSASSTPDAIRYTLDTSSGFDHELTFSARTRPDSLGTDDMEVVWNGEVIQTISPASDWETITVRLPALSASSGVLELRELSANSENDDHGILLDDVAIQKLTTISATEDTAFEFDLSATLADNDGSETLSLSLTGIPSGYTISDGTHSVVSSGTGIDISDWNLNSLSLDPQSNANTDFTITLSATSTETSGGDSSTTTQAIQVELQAVNDTATFTGDNTGTLIEDSAATLSTSGSLNVSDIDTGEASFTAETINGTHGSLTIDANGDWTYSADNSQSAVQSLGTSQALNFEGDWNSSARINSDLVASDDFTVSIWVKPDTVDGDFHGFFGSQPSDVSDRSPSLWVAPDGDLHWSSMDSSGGSFSGAADNVFTQGEWSHITWVKDGTEYRFYKDGELLHTDSAPDNVKLSGFTELGRVDNSLDGQLDDLQTYSRALTPAEIADAMNGETQPDLLSHYDFSGSTLTEALTDKSGNKARGTSNGSLDDADLVTARADTLTETITVQSQDGTTHNITITLSGNNDAPVAASSNAVNLALDEDNSLVITEAQLLARISDIDDSHLSLSDVSLHSGQATLVDNNDGTWTLTPDADWSGTGAISFKVSDGHSITTIQTGFDVASVNDSPLLANAVTDQSVNEDSVFNFTVPENTFSHADGDTLTFTATQSDGSALPSWLSFDASTRVFSGTPDNGDVATLNLKVTATDEDGEAKDASFNLMVNNVNDAPSPVFAEDNGLISIEAEHFSSQVNRSGNAWTVENDASASGGQQVHTANNDADGFDTQYTGVSSELTYDIQFDSAGTYYVWVRGDAPDGLSDSVHIGLNGDAVSTGSRIDFNEGSHDWAGDRMDSAGRITIEVEAPGVHQLNLWMREDGIAVDKVVISDDVNYVPSGSGPAESDYVGLSDQTATEESAFNYTIDANAFNDLDGDSLTFSAILTNGDPLPSWMSFDAGTRTFSGTPDDPDLGTLQVRVTASDGSLSSSANVSITVTGVNDAPTTPTPEIDTFDFTWGGTSINGKTTETYTLSDDFNLGDTVWVHKTDDVYRKAVELQISDNGDGTLNFKAVSAAYTTLTNWNSLSAEQQASFFESGSGTSQTIATSNSEGDYGVSDITINQGPTVSGFLDNVSGKNIHPFSTSENGLDGVVVGTVSASDIEGDALTYTLSDDAGGRFTINGSTGQVTVADGSLLNYEAANTHTITVQVSDGQLTSDQSYTIQLSDINDAPELVGTIDDQTVAEESAFSYSLPTNAFSDDDGDSLTFNASLASGDPLPAWLTFEAGTQTFSGTPDDPDVGNLSVKISVSDGSETTDVFWSVNVTAVNDDPETVSDTNTDEASIEGAAITGSASVLANDSDVENDPLSISDVNGTSVSGSTTIEGDYGNLTIAEDGNWTYTPSSVDLSSDLIAHWTFDESSGNTASDSAAPDSHSDDSTLKEGATFVSGGLNGNAVQFDGASAIVDITDSSDLNVYSGNKTERTIDFSFKLDGDNDLSGRQVLFEEGGGSKGYNTYIDEGSLYVGAWANENGWDNGTYLTTDISSLDSSDWQQVSLVLDADNNSLKAYLNGEEFGSGHAESMGEHSDEASFGSVSLHYNENSGETLRGTTRFHDGSVDQPDDHYGFDGLIDEARIYDRALSPQEIKALGYEFESDTLQDTFTYTVSDGTDTATSTLTIDVNRVPEALSGTLSAAEDGGVIAGQLSATDLDVGESLTFAAETQPSEGSVTVNADGSYSFNPGSDFQDLAQGATRDVTFDYRVTDAQGDSSTNTVTITVTGINDTASVTSVETYTEDFNDFSAGDLNGQSGWVTEKFNSSVDLELADIGQDGSQALQFTKVSASAAGSLLNTVPDLNDASTFAFEADIAKNWWGSDVGIGGDNNSDGKIGKNDNEVAISIKPADHNDSLTLTLADGSTQTVSFSPADGNGWARFRVEVDFEANSGSGAVTVKYKDLPAGEVEWTTVSGLSGIDAQLNPAASDHTNPENWNGIYVNGDEAGVQIDNLMLEAKGDTTNTVLTEDRNVDGSGNLVKSGLLIVSDTDAGENSFTAETLTGNYGSLTIDSAGNWTYTASNSQAAIQGLDDGETLTDTITIQTADGTTHDISVVINGLNDGPAAANVDLGSSNEDTDLIITQAQLLANSSDVDGDSLSITALTLDNGSHGTLTDNGDSTWT